MTQRFTIAQAADPDLHYLLRENNQAVPNVNRLAMDDLHRLLAMSRSCLVARTKGFFAGFMVLLGPRQPYSSINYQWFNARHRDFLYVDRVVVCSELRGHGVGKALYRAAIELGGEAGRLTCEVNLRPPNERSLAFHHALGFTEVGQQDTEGGSKHVSLLELPLG